MGAKSGDEARCQYCREGICELDDFVAGVKPSLFVGQFGGQFGGQDGGQDRGQDGVLYGV